jgi:kumamolisin
MKFNSHKVRCPRTETALTPAQVAQAYSFPEGVDISGRSITILELGGAFQLSDIAAYCKRYGYVMPQIMTVSVDGALEQSDPTGADGEVGLDICVIMGALSKCTGVADFKIIVVFSPNTDQGFIDGEAKCLSLDSDATSISWGSPEDTWDDGSRQQLDESFEQAEQKGSNVFAAAGDNGSSDGESGEHCDYPASSPYTIACGGTSLQLASDGTRQSETAWSTGFLGTGNGTGGGRSTVYPAQSWQVENGVKQAPGRCVPDVAANADPNTGYLVDIDGSVVQIGGTSACAPLYAALQVIMNAVKGEHIGNMHTKLYQHPECFFDVVEGSNGAYKAGPGYDLCTGLGVLEPQKFLTAIE